MTIKNITIDNYNTSTVVELSVKERISIVNCMDSFANDNGKKSEMVRLVNNILEAQGEQAKKEASKAMESFLISEADLNERCARILTESMAEGDRDKTKFLLGDIAYSATW
ncbi:MULTISPECIES: hypothetical protein [Vibrio]|uniref:hypothetical protein n=1 Tax=Vibrio TaxID=662 RepID=UPI003D14C590